MSSHSHAEHSGPHISPLSLYLKVYGGLLFLTIVTVGISYMGLPATLSIIVAMIVATIKAFCVCYWFMHLSHDTPFNKLFFIAAIWFIAVFFIFTIFDLSSRDRIMKDSSTFQLRSERAEKVIIEKPVEKPAEAAH